MKKKLSYESVKVGKLLFCYKNVDLIVLFKFY